MNDTTSWSVVDANGGDADGDGICGDYEVAGCTDLVIALMIQQLQMMMDLVLIYLQVRVSHVLGLKQLPTQQQCVDLWVR